MTRSTPPLIGTYQTPPVTIGERVTCLYRDADCVVTSIHDAPILWPRVRAIEVRGGSGLWVNEDLVRAIRTESASALMHWFGVGSKAVWNWRKAFGITEKFGTEGSRLAHQEASQLGAEGIKVKDWTDEECDAIAERSKRLGLRPPNRWVGTGWTPEQIAMLGTASDEVVARMIGRSDNAVRLKRERLGILRHEGRK